MLTDALYQAKQWTDEDRSLAKYTVFFFEGGGRFDSAAGEKKSVLVGGVLFLTPSYTFLLKS